MPTFMRFERPDLRPVFVNVDLIAFIEWPQYSDDRPVARLVFSQTLSVDVLDTPDDDGHLDTDRLTQPAD